MTLRLYSYWRSSASWRVRIALESKGLPYEYVAVHLLREGGEQHKSEYRSVNPQGRVPTLEIDGLRITQSLAIMEWLEDTHPEPALLPADPAGRARVRSLAQLIACDIQPLQNLSTSQYLADAMELPDDKVNQWLVNWIRRGMTALETRLAGEAGTGQFSHGDEPTIADACLVPQCYAAARFGVDPGGFPRIARINATCIAHPAFQRAAPEAQPDAPK